MTDLRRAGVSRFTSPTGYRISLRAHPVVSIYIAEIPEYEDMLGEIGRGFKIPKRP